MSDELYRITLSAEKDLAVLQVTRDVLELSDREAFMAGCRELLASDAGRLVIDLRDLRRVFSVFVGTVMDVNVHVREEGRKLVVLASEAVSEVFGAVGVNAELDIRTRSGAAEDVALKRRSSRTFR